LLGERAARGVATPTSSTGSIVPRRDLVGRDQLVSVSDREQRLSASLVACAYAFVLIDAPHR
jgi:hypothetical protein